MSHNKIKSKLMSILTGKEENEHCLTKEGALPTDKRGSLAERKN